MIDIHSHVIPGVDDGVQTLEESLELASMEQSGGTRFFVATSHVNSKLDLDRTPVLFEKVAQLNSDYEAAGLTVRVLPGAELYCSMHILDALEQGKPISLAGTGKYLLIDSPHTSLPHDFESVLFELVLRNITPILAHPERCAAIQMEPSRVEIYRERGMALQLNAKSFEGRYGPRAQELAYEFFNKRMAHFLSSDAHRPGSRPILGSIADALRTPEHADYVDLLTNRSGEAIRQGLPLPELPAPPELKAKATGGGSWFSRAFRGRR